MSCVTSIYRSGLPVDLVNPQWDEMQNIEMAARVLTRQNLVKVLDEGQLKDVDVESLDRVLFKILYPTVPDPFRKVERAEGAA